jgi:cytochrome c-type biogenesis protein CcmH
MIRPRLALSAALGLALLPSALAFAQASEPAFDLPQARPEQVVGAPKGQPLTGAALERRSDEIGALLRCPVCQGLSVADSRAGTAVAMKGQVRDMLAAGYDQEQILAFFERSYGGFVRLEPPLRGVNWLVWLAPLAGLLLGGFVVMRALRAPRPAGAETSAQPQAAAAAELPQRDTLPDDVDLARYVRRVRELAYGWPEGQPPRLS